MFKKIFEIIQWFTGGFFVACFLLSLLPQFEALNKTIFIIGLLSMLVFLLLFFQKIFSTSILSKLRVCNMLTMCVLCGLLISPIVNVNSWQSEKILYLNGQFKSQTIELHSKSCGDYDEYRIVRVVNYCHLISHISSIDTSNVKLPWFPVETEGNHIYHF